MSTLSLLHPEHIDNITRLSTAQNFHTDIFVVIAVIAIGPKHAPIQLLLSCAIHTVFNDQNIKLPSLSAHYPVTLTLLFPNNELPSSRAYAT